ncbi:MAG TPA: zinc ribbon domain-containing protein [Pyrinomonadaceae bacterium]|nr:zinc ribbon domain-containing protein [Pyrinomonadaceae bacterium]HNU07260.1 zinc ribbon domain-containing protein [Pyrinomonadaceae bacterium]
MYCSSCGNEINDTLNFCKRCGKRLEKGVDPATAKSMFDTFMTSTAAVIVGGLGILIGLVAVLLKNGVDPAGVGVIAVIYLVALTFTSFMLLRMLPKLIDARLSSSNSETPETYVAPQLDSRSPAQLIESKQPTSIVENTTRNFDEIPR